MVEKKKCASSGARIEPGTSRVPDGTLTGDSTANHDPTVLVAKVRLSLPTECRLG